MSDEPLVMTLAEAMEYLAQQHMWLTPYVWSLDEPTAWEVHRWPTYEEETFHDKLAVTVGRWPSWPEAVSVALGRPVVERDDKAELVQALRTCVQALQVSGTRLLTCEAAARREGSPSWADTLSESATAAAQAIAIAGAALAAVGEES